MGKNQDEKFNPEETQKRFEAALRGARIAGPKPKSVTPKRKKVQQKKKKR
jgi:hypothetical protein